MVKHWTPATKDRKPVPMKDWEQMKWALQILKLFNILPLASKLKQREGKPRQSLVTVEKMDLRVQRDQSS